VYLQRVLAGLMVQAGADRQGGEEHDGNG
jgi:hypothetical protein